MGQDVIKGREGHDGGRWGVAKGERVEREKGWGAAKAKKKINKRRMAGTKSEREKERQGGRNRSDEK